jgi:uncharacterized protein (DUF342 family)
MEITHDKRVQVVSQSGSVWQVIIFLSSLEDSAREEMVYRLRDAKRLIADEYEVPYEQLELLEVIRKSKVPGGVEAEVSIIRTELGKGMPVVTLKAGVSPNGGVFSDMLAELDFSYIDEFDHQISLDRIKTEIGRAGVALGMCNLDDINESLEKVHKNKSQKIGLHIAKGTFPEEGVDAQLEYTFYTAHTEEMKIAEYVKGRKVREGDMLCQKIPPTHGLKSGIDVRGGTIPPVKGLDFELLAGDGVERSKDGNMLRASIDGIATMERTTQRVYTVTGEKVVPKKIQVDVRPVIQINAEDIDELVTEDCVEVMGTLKEGASIRTKGEVFLDGGLKEGATVMAGSLVMINGEIQDGSISSDNSVLTGSDVKSTSIVASEDVEVHGIAENSTIVGRNVSAKGARGSNIVAGESLKLGHARSNQGGKKTTIEVGRKSFYLNKLESTLNDLKTLKTSYDKICCVFGDELIKKLVPSNQQWILIQHLRNIREGGGGKPDDKKVQCMKKLLDSLIPFKAIIHEKKAELNALKKRVKKESDRHPVVLIREQITDPVDITVNGNTTRINQN